MLLMFLNVKIGVKMKRSETPQLERILTQKQISREGGEGWMGGVISYGLYRLVCSAGYHFHPAVKFFPPIRRQVLLISHITNIVRKVITSSLLTSFYSPPPFLSLGPMLGVGVECIISCDCKLLCRLV